MNEISLKGRVIITKFPVVIDNFDLIDSELKEGFLTKKLGLPASHKLKVEHLNGAYTGEINGEGWVIELKNAEIYMFTKIDAKIILNPAQGKFQVILLFANQADRVNAIKLTEQFITLIEIANVYSAAERVKAEIRRRNNEFMITKAWLN